MHMGARTSRYAPAGRVHVALHLSPGITCRSPSGAPSFIPGGHLPGWATWPVLASTCCLARAIRAADLPRPNVRIPTEFVRSAPASRPITGNAPTAAVDPEQSSCVMKSASIPADVRDDIRGTDLDIVLTRWSIIPFEQSAALALLVQG